MSCDVVEVKERLENELCSFSNLSVTSHGEPPWKEPLWRASMPGIYRIPIWNYRVIQILRAATDGCRLRPWLEARRLTGRHTAAAPKHSLWCNACTTGILYGFRFSNFVALCTDDSDTQISCDKRFRDFWGVCSNLSPVSSNVYSLRTWRQRLTFLLFTEPVSLNRLACLRIVLVLGTGRPGNFIRNLRRVSEHNFLLFIYVLWIYTCSRNENYCLSMSQIAIITITTLTALMSNNNHNQYTLTSPFCKCTSMRVTNYSETELKKESERLGTAAVRRPVRRLAGQRRQRTTAVCSRA